MYNYKLPPKNNRPLANKHDPHWVKKRCRTRNGADLPCALYDCPWSVLPNDVFHTSGSFRKNHYHRDNTTMNSVTSFPAAFYRLEKTAQQRFCIGISKQKLLLEKHGSLKKWTVTKPFYCPACLRQYLNFEFCRPVSEACLPKETPVWGLQNKFLSTKKVKRLR